MLQGLQVSIGSSVCNAFNTVDTAILTLTSLANHVVAIDDPTPSFETSLTMSTSFTSPSRGPRCCPGRASSGPCCRHQEGRLPPRFSNTMFSLSLQCEEFHSSPLLLTCSWFIAICSFVAVFPQSLLEFEMNVSLLVRLRLFYDSYIIYCSLAFASSISFSFVSSSPSAHRAYSNFLIFFLS